VVKLGQSFCRIFRFVECQPCCRKGVVLLVVIVKREGGQQVSSWCKRDGHMAAQNGHMVICLLAHNDHT